MTRDVVLVEEFEPAEATWGGVESSTLLEFRTDDVSLRKRGPDWAAHKGASPRHHHDEQRSIARRAETTAVRARRSVCAAASAGGALSLNVLPQDGLGVL